MSEELPDPYTYLYDPKDYLKAIQRYFPSIQITPRVSLGLGPMEFEHPKKMRKELSKEPTRFGGSWLGGVPFVTGEPWPTNRQGKPLTHIAQVDLGYEAMNVGDPGFLKSGLPGEGIIQLFHDTESMGDPEDYDDAEVSAWAVRYFLPDTDDLEELELEVPPVGVAGSIPMIPLDIDAFMNVKDQFSIDFGSTREADVYGELVELTEFEIYNRLLRYEAKLPERRPEDPEFIPAERISRMSGFSACEIRAEYDGQLPQVLPLVNKTDSHVLLFEINPRTFETPGWFHERPLQVWIRKSDLEVRNFSRVWCMIRTDS